MSVDICKKNPSFLWCECGYMSKGSVTSVIPMEKMSIAPGFRFRPTDVELVRYYLKRKVMGKKLLSNGIAELDVYKFEPPDLPDKGVETGDLKWYFFCPREKKYRNGSQAKRSTEAGYWKVTGKDRDVSYKDQVVGRIRTLVFHYGKTGYGDRTDWVMHEYRLQDQELAQNNVPQDAYVLYKVFKKIGYGPRGSDDYGVPFNEEDWSSDGEEEEEDREAIPCADAGPSNGVLSESCVSPLRASDDDDVVAVFSSSPLLEVPQAPPLDDDVGDDELYSMLGFFTVDEDDEPLFFEDQNEVTRYEPEVPEAPPVCLGDGDSKGTPELSDDLYLELEDLIEPVTPPPAQTGDSTSNGQT